MCDLILSFYLGLVGLLLIAILIYIFVELVESYDDLNLIVEKIKYKCEKNERVRIGEMMKRPNKYDFDFSEDYESNLETYCDELESIISKGDCVYHYEKKIESLEKALDKACSLLVEAVSQDCTIFDEVIEEEYILRTEIKEWKEWLMKDE